MSWFSDKPSFVESKLTVGIGDDAYKVYKIGRYDVHVYSDGKLAYKASYGYQGNPTDTFPNMEVVDGVLQIPIEDITDQILARAEPRELARALWQNDEVREQFMECLVDGFDGLTDADQRTFIAKVKEAVHSTALDKAASKLASLEYEHGKRFSFWQEIDRINDTLRNLDVRLSDGSLLRMRDPTQTDQFKIGGQVWNEARDHWRHEIRQIFELEPA